jgi:hypothetical protein
MGRRSMLLTGADSRIAGRLKPKLRRPILLAGIGSSRHPDRREQVMMGWSGDQMILLGSERHGELFQ